MASTDKQSSETEKTAPPLPPASRVPASSSMALADLVLRLLLLASALTAVVVMVASKQTKVVFLPIGQLRIPVTVAAKFNHSSAFIYLVAAQSVAGLYSIVTVLLALSKLSSSGGGTNKLVLHFVITDVVLYGIVAAATGAAGGVGYIGLKGNSHTGWNKICDTYGKFCRHAGASIAVSLFSSFVLLLLVLLSVKNLVSKIPK